MQSPENVIAWVKLVRPLVWSYNNEMQNELTTARSGESMTERKTLATKRDIYVWPMTNFMSGMKHEKTQFHRCHITFLFITPSDESSRSPFL